MGVWIITHMGVFESKMAESKRSKTMDVPFILDGAARIVKAVSKHTTAIDVIAKFPNLQVPLAVFLSVDGVQKQLPGKARLLKVWRANASSKNVAFVIRKSDTAKEKAKGSTRKVFRCKIKCDKPRSESHVTDRLSRESLKRVSDLAFFARNRKKTLQVVGKPSMSKAKNADHPERSKLMRRLTTQSSTNSMDAFLARANLDEIAGHVTAEALRKGTSMYSKQPTLEVTQPIKRTNSDIREGQTAMKLSLKRTFGARNKLSVRTTSTGTIDSTDTGFHSMDNDGHDHTPIDTQSGLMTTKLNKRHPRLLEDTEYGPLHSTPLVAHRQQTHRPENMECTLTHNYFENLDENQGKSVIMEKFMADQRLPASYDTADDQTFDLPFSKRQTFEHQSMMAFQNQRDRCRFLWDQLCDSDSDSDASDCTFDNFTVDSTCANVFTQKVLRRESAFTDLRKCTVSTRFSLPAYTLNTQRNVQQTEFDYSFNCSFPRMDNDYHSMDFSCSFDESDRSDVIDRMLDDRQPVSDKSLDSFMRTRSFLEDCDGDITACGENPLEMNIVGSDQCIH
ncbi:uncharacterized protein LOC128229861 [Mya arenaria]|uniref:uncharacterized protein LOC128229861 n=1 Tax=Mya arenaria TaxID=6604 RepID=UPI0022E26C7F|nr:uncharacterized protein LOC128229861 [Mya arenaria]